MDDAKKLAVITTRTQLEISFLRDWKGRGTAIGR